MAGSVEFVIFEEGDEAGVVQLLLQAAWTREATPRWQFTLRHRHWGVMPFAASSRPPTSISIYFDERPDSEARWVDTLRLPAACSLQEQLERLANMSPTSRAAERLAHTITWHTILRGVVATGRHAQVPIRNAPGPDWLRTHFSDSWIKRLEGHLALERSEGCAVIL